METYIQRRAELSDKSKREDSTEATERGQKSQSRTYSPIFNSHQEFVDNLSPEAQVRFADQVKSLNLTESVFEQDKVEVTEKSFQEGSDHLESLSMDANTSTLSLVLSDHLKDAQFREQHKGRVQTWIHGLPIVGLPYEPSPEQTEFYNNLDFDQVVQVVNRPPTPHPHFALPAPRAYGPSLYTRTSAFSQPEAAVHETWANLVDSVGPDNELTSGTKISPSTLPEAHLRSAVNQDSSRPAPDSANYSFEVEVADRSDQNHQTSHPSDTVCNVIVRDPELLDWLLGASPSQENTPEVCRTASHIDTHVDFSANPSDFHQTNQAAANLVHGPPSDNSLSPTYVRSELTFTMGQAVPKLSREVQEQPPPEYVYTDAKIQTNLGIESLQRHFASIYPYEAYDNGVDFDAQLPPPVYHRLDWFRIHDRLLRQKLAEEAATPVEYPPGILPPVPPVTTSATAAEAAAAPCLYEAESQPPELSPHQAAQLQPQPYNPSSTPDASLESLSAEALGEMLLNGWRPRKKPCKFRQPRPKSEPLEQHLQLSTFLADWKKEHDKAKQALAHAQNELEAQEADDRQDDEAARTMMAQSKDKPPPLPKKKKRSKGKKGIGKETAGKDGKDGAA